MVQRAVVVGVALLASWCGDRALSQRQFCELVVERAEESYPGVLISDVDERGFDYVRGDGDHGRIVVTEEYIYYTRNPDALDDVVDRVASLIETRRHIQRFEQTGRVTGSILPVLKAPGFLHEAEARAGGQPLLFGEHSTGLLVFYVVDQPTSISYMTTASLEGLGMSTGAVGALALENLVRRTGEDRFVVTFTDDGPIVEGNTNDGYDAARLISPTLLLTLSRVLDTSSVVVAVPRRDLMLAVPAGEPELIERLRARALAEFEAGPYAIVPTLFSLDRAGLRLLEE